MDVSFGDSDYTAIAGEWFYRFTLPGCSARRLPLEMARGAHGESHGE